MRPNDHLTHGSTQMTRILAAASALRPDGALGPYWLRIEAERVVEAGPGEPPAAPDVHLRDGVLTPGFVDVHAHGGATASFTEGEAQGRNVVAAHRQQGTTTMLASLVSAPIEQLLAQSEALRPLVDSGELAGVHLEGPWLSPAHRGAHDNELLSDPSPESVSALLEHPAAELLRYVTLAPERSGAAEAVARLRTGGVTVGIGHTGASLEQTREALAAGATAATHLLNGMKGLHHRDPGPALPLLQDPHAFLELIADGVHIHPQMIRFIWDSAARSGGAGRIVLVSDAMAAAEAGDGTYMLGSMPVEVQHGVARLFTAEGGPGSIAGSTLTLSSAVRNSIVKAAVPPEQALMAATANPAAMIGLHDVGSLAPGAQANLVILDADWHVQNVMHQGRWLDEK